MTTEYTYPIFTVDPTGVLREAFIQKHHPPQTIKELIGLREERLIQILRKKQPIFNGVPELLKRLTKRFPLAIGSGYTHRIIEEVLTMLNLQQYFRCAVSSE